MRAEASVLVSVVIANGVGLAGISGLAVATARFYGQRVPWIYLGAVWALFVISMVVTEIVMATTAYRALTTATGYMLADFAALHAAVRGYRAEPTFNKRILALLFGVLATVNLLRILDVILGGTYRLPDISNRAWCRDRADVLPGRACSFYDRVFPHLGRTRSEPVADARDTRRPHRHLQPAKNVRDRRETVRSKDPIIIVRRA